MWENKLLRSQFCDRMNCQWRNCVTVKHCLSALKISFLEGFLCFPAATKAWLLGHDGGTTESTFMQKNRIMCQDF